MIRFRPALAAVLCAALVLSSAAPAAAVNGRAPLNPRGGKTAHAKSAALNPETLRVAGTFNWTTPAAIPGLIRENQAKAAGTESPKTQKNDTISRFTKALADTVAKQNAPRKAAETANGELHALYQGEKPAEGAAATDASGSGAAPAGPGLSPRPEGSAAPKPTMPRLRSSRHGQEGNAKVALIVAAAAALVIGTIIFFVWRSGVEKNERWLNSKANQDVVAVEKARRENDEVSLENLKFQARDRRKAMREAIADANSRGAKTTAKGEALSEAEAFESFDGLAGARAELNLNAVSVNPIKRVGAEPPARWAERLAKAERDAKQTGFEGPLAVELDLLGAELKSQDAALERLSGDLRSFEGKAVGAFGGAAKQALDRGQADFNEFYSKEVTPERDLLARATIDMRRRVGERLYSENQEFRQHRDHRDRLDGALQGTLKVSADLARGVDGALRDMAKFRQEELDLLEDAGRATDSDTTRRLRNDADDAARKRVQAAADARGRIEALVRLLPSVLNDPALKQEQVLFAIEALLRRDPNSRLLVTSWTWLDIANAWLGPNWQEILSSGSPNANEAIDLRVKFGQVLGAITGVETEIKSRSGSLSDKLNDAVSADIAKQVKEAGIRVEKQ